MRQGSVATLKSYYNHFFNVRVPNERKSKDKDKDIPNSEFFKISAFV